ncbi:MAG: hypothetical protein AAGF12_05875 [Myxococcota bacterium]
MRESNPFQVSISLEAMTAEGDWQSRIRGAGVVWYHDFRSPREVDAFRWTGGIGNDPEPSGGSGSRCRHLDSDGITGGCLEIFRPVGTRDSSSWWRPFSPLLSGWPGNGRDDDDPGAGRIRPRAWNPTRRSELAQHDVGFYMNPVYFDRFSGQHDGSAWYLQLRVKIDPRRAAAGQPSGGKITYFTRNDRSLTSQEINLESLQRGATDGANYFSLYRSGSPPLENDSPGQGSQPGNERGRCEFRSDAMACWAFSGGWDTLLFHIEPGLGGDDRAHPSTLVRVYDAHPGETSYTKIWDQPDAAVPYDVVWGHNTLLCSGYENGQAFVEDAYKRFAQIIFSQDFIPCPQV